MLSLSDWGFCSLSWFRSAIKVAASVGISGMILRILPVGMVDLETLLRMDLKAFSAL